MEQSLNGLGVLHVLLESFPQACIQGVAIILQMTYENDEQCLPPQNKLENLTVYLMDEMKKAYKQNGGNFGTG